MLAGLQPRTRNAHVLCGVRGNSAKLPRTSNCTFPGRHRTPLRHRSGAEWAPKRGGMGACSGIAAPPQPSGPSQNSAKFPRKSHCTFSGRHRTASAPERCGMGAGAVRNGRLQWHRGAAPAPDPPLSFSTFLLWWHEILQGSNPQRPRSQRCHSSHAQVMPSHASVHHRRQASRACSPYETLCSGLWCCGMCGDSETSRGFLYAGGWGEKDAVAAVRRSCESRRPCFASATKGEKKRRESGVRRSLGRCPLFWTEHLNSSHFPVPTRRGQHALLCRAKWPLTEAALHDQVSLFGSLCSIL